MFIRPGLFCLMARAAATTPTTLVATASPTLLLLDEDDNKIVVRVEDEDSSEFKFCDTISDTLGHSDVIGKTETAIGDRSRIDCDLADDGFMHAPLKETSMRLKIGMKLRCALLLLLDRV